MHRPLFSVDKSANLAITLYGICGHFVMRRRRHCILINDDAVVFPWPCECFARSRLKPRLASHSRFDELDNFESSCHFVLSEYRGKLF
jgi:hypothetical protein